MNYYSLFFYMALMLFACRANAGCSDPSLHHLALELHPGRQFDSNLVQCKKWPADPTLSIFVLPFSHGLPISDETTVFDVEIVVVKNDSGKIVASIYQADAWESDAIKIDSVQIDTGRYQLATTFHAFGVRVHSTGSSKANPYRSEELSLFIIKNQSLVAIVEMMASEFRGEWDTNCEGEFEEFDRTLIVLPHKTNGFADLLVKESRTKKTSHLIGTNCKETVVPITKKYTVSFEKSSYSIPKELQGWSSP